MERSEQQQLTVAAIAARREAKALYSGFKVGAALEDNRGTIWTGCNVESSSYGLSICAERVALVKALSEGATGFRRMVIAAGADGDDSPASPCGACRHLLNDYAPGIEIILVNPESGSQKEFTLDELYPEPFSDESLTGEHKA